MEKLKRFLRDSDRTIVSARNKAFRKLGIFLVKQVKLRTPVKTGTLRRSVQYTFSKDLLEIFSRLFYVDYIENGTRYIKPVHMFKSVYDNYYEQIVDMLVKEIERNIK